MRTAEENAAEFGRHEARDGWPLALLVACSVEPGKRGDNQHTGSSREEPPRKITMNAFATAAGRNDAAGRRRIGDDLVRSYYDAWESAADAGIVPHAATLQPTDVDDEWSFASAGDFRDYYVTRPGGRPRDSK